MSALRQLQKNYEQTLDTSFQWNYRILVVEDQKEVAQSYTDILEHSAKVIPLQRSSRSARIESVNQDSPEKHFPFELTIVHSAAEALDAMKAAKAKKQSFAMGFIDVLLGDGMDGIELLKEMQKMDEDFYGVLVTAYHDRDVDSIHRFLGEDKVDQWDYLNKPFTNGEILQKARNYISLWNLQKESKIREKEMQELRNQVFQSERFSTVAAVARGVSHEFGNILLQIMGKAELGQMGDEAKKTHSLEKILEASIRANEILDRFNHLANPGNTEFPKESHNIHNIVSSALDLMEHQLKTQGIKICKIKSDNGKVFVNETSIMQVLTNVFINASHAMPGGGQIDLGVYDQGDFCVLKVRDYGTGIADKALEHVFDAFYTTKGKKGTGLGLSICREIVEIEHSGHFKLYNHEVKGLVIEIQLPRKEVA